MSVRGFLSYRISVTQAILALGVFVFFLSLTADGDLLAGLGVLVLAAVAWSLVVLVQRRRLPARTDRREETGVLPYACEVVWGLIKPAEMAPLLQPSVRLGYQVPGTPEGLGERQAFELDDGTTVVVEVIEYEPNRRAVTRQVSPTFLMQRRSVQAVEPVDGGCTYTEVIEIDLKPGQRIRSEWELLWRSGARERIARIRAILDARSTTTAVRTPTDGPTQRVDGSVADP